MQDQITQLQQKVADMQSKIDSINQSSDIDRDTETALRERLSTDNSLLKGIMMWGVATMTDKTTYSSVTITDTRIKATSVGVACETANSSPDVPYMIMSSGSATIYTQSGGNTSNMNYIIIF